MSKRDEFTPVADQIPFDNETNGFISETQTDGGRAAT